MNLMFASLLLGATFLVGCSGTSTSQKNSASQNSQPALSSALSVTQILDVADKKVGLPVVVTGTVSHVCSHSGRRCFLIDSTGNHSIRIEAKGQIGGFNKELSGSRILVEGILCEKRLNQDYINEWETKTIAQKEKAEDGGNHCNAELANIENMRAWMKANGKDYYSIYYIDGNKYNEVE